MTDIIQTFVAEHLYKFALIVVLCVGAIIVSMVVDLIFGIRKARLNNEATTSTGLKKTCDKARKYFSPLIMLACIDVIATCANVPVPIFTMIWSAWCVFCEFISVREKAWQKAEIRKQERTMSIILENKDDIAKMVVEMIHAKEEEEKQKEAER